MQAQQYIAPLPQQNLYDHLNTHDIPLPPLINQYLGPSGQFNGLDHGGFSRGSSLSYLHQDSGCRYLTDRGGGGGGGLSSRLTPSSLVGTSQLNATGLSITGNVTPTFNMYCPPEEITEYSQWQWLPPQISLHGHGHPSEMVANALDTVPPNLGLEMGFSSLNSGLGGDGEEELSTVLRSPAAQLPTPAAMAVLLNPNNRNEGVYPLPIPTRTTGTAGATPAAVVAAGHGSGTGTRTTRSGDGVPSTLVTRGHGDGQSREKKHACTMCHKRFDRPSTLRKHLLVHTGEKAFVCGTCGRRFGVASNLNRHVRRCILKPVHTPPTTSVSASPPASSTTSNNDRESASAEKVIQKGTKRSLSPLSTLATVACNRVTDQKPFKEKPAQKRRRRAPSPSQWIPHSLLSFNLTSEDFLKSTMVPLPPVRRNLPKEERDSWDENVGPAPYHPCGWRGILPGPGIGLASGLGGRDMRNMNMGSGNGFAVGSVLVC